MCIRDRLSGSLGDHGMAVMAQREHLSFDAPIVSDTAALHGLVAAMVATGAEIHCLRDPTRGGLGSALNEIAQQSGVGMRLREAAIPAVSYTHLDVYKRQQYHTAMDMG